MLTDAAEVGATKALARVGKTKEYITKAEAYRRYGRGAVDGWVRTGVVSTHKDDGGNAHLRLSSIQLEIAAKTSNYGKFYKYSIQK